MTMMRFDYMIEHKNNLRFCAPEIDSTTEDLKKIFWEQTQKEKSEVQVNEEKKVSKRHIKIYYKVGSFFKRRTYFNIQLEYLR